MSKFYVRYRVKGYCLADAFRPQPGWGYRNFYVDSDKLGTDVIEEIKTAAIQTAPNGYEFISIERLAHWGPATPTAETEGAGL